jgi:hypothetical protein
MLSDINKSIFEAKAPKGMSYEKYVETLEKGFEILGTNEDFFKSCKDLDQFRAVRLALTYRIEMIRQNRKKKFADYAALAN